MHRIAFDSPFTFGDVVDFDSRNGTGQGRVIDIVLSNDGSVSYVIDTDGESLTGGITPAEMTLVRPAPAPTARAD